MHDGVTLTVGGSSIAGRTMGPVSEWTSRSSDRPMTRASGRNWPRVCQNAGSRLSFKKSAFENGLQRPGGVPGRVTGPLKTFSFCVLTHPRPDPADGTACSPAGRPNICAPENRIVRLNVVYFDRAHG
jgi:hypothetical protein